MSHKPKIVLFYFIWCALGCSFHCLFVTEVFNVSIHAVNWTVRTMCTAVLLLHEVLNQTVQQRLLKDFCHNLTEHKLQMGKSIQQVAFLPKTVTYHAFSKDVPLQTSLHRVQLRKESNDFQNIVRFYVPCILVQQSICSTNTWANREDVILQDSVTCIFRRKVTE